MILRYFHDLLPDKKYDLEKIIVHTQNIEIRFQNKKGIWIDVYITPITWNTGSLVREDDFEHISKKVMRE